MTLIRRLLKLKDSFNYVKLQKFSTKAQRKSAAVKRAAEHGDQFPVDLFNKKMKTPDSFYLANEATANVLDSLINPFLNEIKCDTAVEINPGAGYFTKKLLDREEQFRKIVLIESLEHFMPHLNEMHSLYPERVKVKQGDFIGIWKLACQDKRDRGQRVAELLADLQKRDSLEKAASTVIFGAVGSYNFFKHLINSVVFQNSLFNILENSEMFLVVPPPIYIHLTCSNEIGYMIYRSTSILFQILFEYRFIAPIPRDQFLPAEVQFNPSKFSKLLRIKTINPEFLYLVKVKPRPNLHELCSSVDLPALWYFVKQNCISRRNRIIPNLEKYVNGSGPRLIINKKNRKGVKVLYKNEDTSKLPQFSKQCTTMSSRDYYPNMNIYTEFGDLSPSQMLTLFNEFRQWPEYAESSFLASLENSLLKLETSEEENIDGIGLTEEDDATGNELLLHDDITKEETAKKSKRVAKKQKASTTNKIE